MKNFVVTALIMMLSTISADAQLVSSADVKAGVAKAVEKGFEKKIEGDVEVKVTGTPFAQLQLPDGKITYKVVSGCDKILPRDIKRIDIYVDNAFIKSLNLPCQTTLYREVLVATDTIAMNQTLTRDCTATKRMDVSMKADYALTDIVLSKEPSARKTFQKGEIIDKRFVKMRPDVQRNGEVRVFFVSNGNVMITINGTAKEDGMCGDYIYVENKNYKRVYNGKVIGENRVLVNI